MRTLLLYVLFLCSGAAGLIYELVWVRELIFVFGGTTYAITTVLVAFMAGLGLGSFFAGRRCHLLQRPGRVYGGLEIAIGLYALSVPFLLTVAVPAYRGLYPHLADWPWLLNFIRFGIGGLILIIPTTCMGATLPVLVRYLPPAPTAVTFITPSPVQVVLADQRGFLSSVACPGGAPDQAVAGRAVVQVAGGPVASAAAKNLQELGIAIGQKVQRRAA